MFRILQIIPKLLSHHFRRAGAASDIPRHLCPFFHLPFPDSVTCSKHSPLFWYPIMCTTSTSIFFPSGSGSIFICNHISCWAIHQSSLFLLNCLTRIVMKNVYLVYSFIYRFCFSPENPPCLSTLTAISKSTFSRILICLKSLRVRSTSTTPLQRQMYSASNVNLDTTFCFREFQGAAAPAMITAISFVDYLSLKCPAQSESAYVTGSVTVSSRNHRPRVAVSLT